MLGDNNQKLLAIRRLVSIIQEDLDRNGHAHPHEVDRLANLIVTLDESISHGGPLPLAWIENREKRAEAEGKIAEQVKASTYTRSKR